MNSTWSIENLDAFYGWDNEGKMTTMVSPGGGQGGDKPMQYVYTTPMRPGGS